MVFARAHSGSKKHSGDSGHEPALSAMLVRLDLRGCIVAASEEFLAHAGQSIEEMRGMYLADFLDPLSQRALAKCIAQVKDGKLLSTHLLLRANDGLTCRVDLCLDGSPQQPGGVVLMIHPSESEAPMPAKLKNGLNSAQFPEYEKIDDVIYTADAQGICRSVNPAIQKYKITPTELIGHRFAEFTAPEDRENSGRLFQNIFQGESAVFEFRVMNRLGERFHVRSFNQPIYEEGQVIGVRGLLIDGVISSDFRRMLERRAAQLSVLNRIGEELFLEVDLNQILENAVQLLQSSFGYFHVAIFVPDAETGTPLMTARAGSISSLFPQKHSLNLGQGLIGTVFQERKTLLANNVALEPRYVNFYPERIPTRSELVVPIQTGEQFYGVLDAQSPEENAFDQNDVLAFETVSHQLAMGIENANLYHQVSQRLQQQERAEALMRLQRDLLAGLSATGDFSETLHVILDTLTRIEGIDGGSIYLIDETGGLDMVAHTGLTPAFAAAVSYLPPEAHKSQFVRQGRIDYMRYADLPFDPRIPADVRADENILCLAVLPIKHQADVIADLTLCSHSLADIPMDARVVLESVASQLGATIARIKMAKALAANQAQGKAMFEAVPDLILVLDSSGWLHHMKPASDGSNYFLSENIVGKRLQSIMPAADANFVLDQVREALASHQTQTFHYEIPTDGVHPIEFFEARVSAVDDEMAIAIVRNDTARRLAEMENDDRERKYRALFELNHDAVFLFTQDGRFLEANPQAYPLLGFSHEDLQGMSYLDLVAPEEREQAVQRFSALQAGEKFPLYERTFMHKNGERIPCEVNIAVVIDANGRPLHVQSILRDISPQKETESRLKYTCSLAKLYSAIITRLIESTQPDGYYLQMLDEIGTPTRAARDWLVLRDEQQPGLLRSFAWQSPGVTSGPGSQIAAGGDIEASWAAFTAQSGAAIPPGRDGAVVLSPRDSPMEGGRIAAAIFSAGRLYGYLALEAKPGRPEWQDEEIEFLHNLAVLIGRKAECV